MLSKDDGEAAASSVGVKSLHVRVLLTALSCLGSIAAVPVFRDPMRAKGGFEIRNAAFPNKPEESRR